MEHNVKKQHGLVNLGLTSTFKQFVRYLNIFLNQVKKNIHSGLNLPNSIYGIYCIFSQCILHFCS